ncbi:polyphosphate kinase 1 [Thermopirellula anaerolimosa]
MSKKKTPEPFFNRELSWLEFNHRVLAEGLADDVPLLERLKFLAIVSTNLDEFFMIRVAGIIQLIKSGSKKRDPAGMTPREQLDAVRRRVHRMAAEQSAGIRQAMESLREEGLCVLRPREWSAQDRRYLSDYFESELSPLLTPLAMSTLDPPPVLAGLQVHAAFLLTRGKEKADADRIAVVPIPLRQKRFVALPGDKPRRFVLIEDILLEFGAKLFRGFKVEAACVFRVTRDADVSIQDDDASDLLSTVESAVLARRRRDPLRLEVTPNADSAIVEALLKTLFLHREDVYDEAEIVGAGCLWELAGLPGFDHLRAADWPPQPPRDLLGWDDLWQAIQHHDVLLFHPYESFDPVVELVRRAAEDPDVLVIKQTLYRTSGDSPIVEALENAARNDKEVTVLVEVKARFDEARNVQWARRLEDAGAHVVYGVAGYKTHAKAMLIVRREGGRIRRYVHLSTGNYNDRTARIYSDLGLLTCDTEIAADASSLFNILTGYSEAVGWNKLTTEPGLLKQRFLELIEREIRVSTPEQPGMILAKINSLQDREIISALYRASQSNVRIKLNVRGICCLVPGVPGVSGNIEVRSIVDRFLEHARIFYFSNGGHDEIYLSSADWMQRNLDRRFETIFPVEAPELRSRLLHILDVFFADNVKAWTLQSDGEYRRARGSGPPIRAQEVFHQEAVAAARETPTRGPKYQVLKAPQD